MYNKYLAYLGAILIPLISQNLIAQSENSLSLINDSTIARYRFEVQQKTHAEIPTGSTIHDIDLLERELLKPLSSKKKIALGINASSEMYYEVVNLEYIAHEDWLTLPYLQLLTPQGNYSFDENRILQSFTPHNSIVSSEHSDLTQFISTEGFNPVMTFFPRVRDPFVEKEINNGAVLYNLPNEAFKISKPNDELTIKPDLKEIISLKTRNNSRIETKITYSLFAPYGYVPILKETRTTRTDLSNPITLVEKSTFSNHVIEDMPGLIKKYTDNAHLEIFPSPIFSSYEILLRGLPDALVSKVQVRDHIGNILQTHHNPSISQDIISLNGSIYPAGVLIILVYTDKGIYSQTVTKI